MLCAFLGFSQNEETVLVPPDTREVDSGDGEEENGGFHIDWDQLSSAQLDLSTVEYSLMKDDNEDEEEEELATLPLICHRVRVQR